MRFLTSELSEADLGDSIDTPSQSVPFWILPRNINHLVSALSDTQMSSLRLTEPADNICMRRLLMVSEIVTSRSSWQNTRDLIYSWMTRKSKC